MLKPALIAGARLPASLSRLAALLASCCLALTAGASAETCRASYYAHAHHGRTTASGERFDMNAATCAHKSHAFGTRLRVTVLSSGRSAVCRVNDRGPFVKGRCVDVSLGVARSLDMIRAGVAKVRVDVLN